ncbi:GntR family transcriptional regulator [Herbiconiux solani]|uniref:GntR family transcriptional regulator n=1 Tax=Herbiconiux solani TaxID=661329 RepID=UPI0008248608|nr:GntR family transcriptional regulator [Herbiconiux solani]
MTIASPFERPRLGGSRGQMVADDVYDQVTRMILRNEVAPGVRLNIEALAHHFAVSATPVREALARLEADGLVEREHLKGYRARGLLSRKELLDLFELRLLLEPHAAGQAAEDAAPAELDGIVAEFEASGSAPSGADYDSYKEFSAHDARLHRLILVAAGNQAVADAVDRMHFHLHAFRLSYDNSSGQETVSEHRAIVEALTARDRAAAESAMTAHIANARSRLSPHAGS